MLPGWVLLLTSLLYAALLFAVAYYGDRRPLYPERTWLRPIVYSLALAVYCSSWTFYGAVGSAVASPWSFLPIYLGPVLLFLFFPGVLARLIQIAREQNITSIADFVGTRYGKSPGLAAMVTLLAIFAAIPYIALQFKAGAMSIAVLSGVGSGGQLPVLQDSAFWLALLLAVFSILFGTRQINAGEHHHGLMLAVALESVVKLVAFVAVGLFALSVLEPAQVPSAELLAEPLPGGFFASTVLALLAMFCLPRQFQVGVVECENPGDLRTARWLFPIYLGIISLLVLPIAWAGLATSPGNGVTPDAFVLTLPMSQGHTGLALLAYLGGFSAATGMVIVASVALATMVSNDLVMPALLRWRTLRLEQRSDLSGIVLGVRRATIVALALAAYLYYRLLEENQSLASIGLLAFAAVAQFAPAIIGGLYWRGASRVGALGGLAAGFALWGYTLLLPTLGRAGLIDTGWFEAGAFDLAALRPQALFGLSGWNEITHGAFWSLLANIACFVFLSLRYRPSVDERLQALPFLDPWMQRGAGGGEWRGRISVQDLQVIARRILGERAAQRAFAEYFEASGRALAAAELAERGLIQHTEKLLAGAIGGASARRVLTTALRGTGLDLGEVVSLLDETSQELRFNRELLGATLENISQGISVVDADMRLVAWNRRYLELFDFPDGMVYVGRPVADLIRWNAERGEMGEGDVEAMVQRRLEHMRQGTAHVFERVRPDGSVLELRGQPMPGGGFVTTFTDVTAYKHAEAALIEAKAELERRVDERTAELQQALEAQRAAKQEAEAANLSKTRFLAAASHDLLQPLNAARLFTAALGTQTDLPPASTELAQRIESALRAAEELLDGLLDVSRLDAGSLRPEPGPVAVERLAQSLKEQFGAQAEARGLDLRLRVQPLLVYSDRALLRRILQNFLANALRYTAQGGVLLACRRRGDSARFEVWDTGPGIPPEQQAAIFAEFQRGESASPWGEKGLGLGLSICQRMAGVLGHRIRLISRLGRGSCFAIEVPLAAAGSAVQAAVPAPPQPADLSRLRVLCVDNDPEILEGMRALLTRWGLSVQTAPGLERALVLGRAEPPDLLLVDFHLNEALDGLAVLDILRQSIVPAPPGALITADGSEEVARRARDGGYPLLYKPVKPAALRALIAALARRRG
jgi:Na+/proline symporter/signal transduction histidine kinase